MEKILIIFWAAGREGSQEDKAELKTLTENHLRHVAQKHHCSFTPNTRIVLTVNVNAETLVGAENSATLQEASGRPHGRGLAVCPERVVTAPASFSHSPVHTRVFVQLSLS